VSARPARRLAHFGALGLAFLLVLAPWVARNYRVHGQLIPVAAAGSQLPVVPQEDVVGRGLLVAMARWAGNDPAGFATRVARQFVQFWELTPTRMMTDDPVKREELHRQDPRLSVEPLFSRRLRDQVSAGSFALELGLALVGLVVVARTRWRQALLPVAVILAFAAGYALFVAKLRYRIPILPLLFLFTGAGAAAIYSLVARAAGRAALSSTTRPP
jgi:hypothetical protein